MEKNLIDVTEIVNVQKTTTAHWHQEIPKVTQEGFLAIVAENHLNNFELWHEEDKARRDDKGFEYVYRAKRNIDQYNQNRNNKIEAMDAWIVTHYQPPQSGCPFNSETPGMMIDRLSILALKDYHMALQTQRDDVGDEHLKKCQHKCAVIHQQRDNLALALSELLVAMQAGTRSFHVYYQFKMYNDPNLNPQLYKNRSHVSTE